MSGRHIARGAAAESYAARALEKAGYRILLRNARTGAGEIDIVAMRRGVFAFVEVKSRTIGTTDDGPHAAFTDAKWRRVGGAAERLLRDRGVPDAPRTFIGAAVTLAPTGEPTEVDLLELEEIR